MQNHAHQHQAHPGGDRLRLAGQRLARLMGKVPPARWKQAAMLLITVWLAYSLAQLFWLLMPEPEVTPARLSAASISFDSGSTTQRAVDIDTLKGLYLFGASAPGSATEEPVPVVDVRPRIEDDAIDTKLNLVLRGVVASNQEESARAIIADARNQSIYSPGDDIEGLQGVKLAKVLNQRVILDNRGQYESLWLYSDNPNAPRTRVRYNESDLPPSRSWDGDDGSASADDHAGAMPIEVATQEMLQASPEDLPQTIEQMGENLSDVVAFNIHREGGRVRGYRIRPGRNADAFHSLGLQSGDIVTAVNGTSLDNPGRIMEIYRELGNATSASLEIERDGQIVTVDVGLN